MSEFIDDPDAGTALEALPLVGPYMRMQAGRLGIVDVHLRDLEAAMAREYYVTDKLPMHLTTVVQALSELWIFGLYEFLRTWRQHVNEAIDYGTELGNVSARDADEAKRKDAIIEKKVADLRRRAGDEDPFFVQSFRRVEKNGQYLERLCAARDAVVPIFRS